MILVDTSVWVEHLRHGDAALAALLDRDEVLIHTFVIGELALGDLRPRGPLLSSLRLLPAAPVASVAEVDGFVERERLFGTGIGYVDAHLLAATRLAADARLLTYDRRLRAVAERLGLSADAGAPRSVP